MDEEVVVSDEAASLVEWMVIVVDRAGCALNDDDVVAWNDETLPDKSASEVESR